MTLPSHVDLLSHHAHHAAVQTSRLHFQERQSLVLRWTWGQRVYEAEASPLEGFGIDSFESCRDELLRIDAEVLPQVAQAMAASAAPLAPLAEWAESFESPAARFALEHCLLSHWSALQDKPLWQALRELSPLAQVPAPESLPTSAVLDPLATDATRQAERLFQAGVRTLKLKVGRHFEQEWRCLEELQESFGEQLRYRLDPNQGWSSAELSALANSSARAQIDWVEDPVEDVESWRELERPVPIAGDEILIGQEPCVEFLELARPDLLVLKPMALGGYTVCLRWAEQAQKCGQKVSVSHLFDGPLALDACVQLAFAIQSPGVTPGLGLHRGLEAWTTSSAWVQKDRMERPRGVGG